MGKHNHPHKVGNLIKGKCPECGGILEINKTADAAVCPYCGMPYIVEKAINNYISTANIDHVQNINAQVVNVNISNEKRILSREEKNSVLSKEIDTKMDRAEQFIQRGKYEEAETLCSEVIRAVKLNPDINRQDIWLNWIIAHTRNYTLLTISNESINAIEMCYENAQNVEPLSFAEEEDVSKYQKRVVAYRNELWNKRVEYENNQLQLYKKLAVFSIINGILLLINIFLVFITACLFGYRRNEDFTFTLFLLLLGCFMLLKMIIKHIVRKYKRKISEIDVKLENEISVYERMINNPKPVLA